METFKLNVKQGPVEIVVNGKDTAIVRSEHFTLHRVEYRVNLHLVYKDGKFVPYVDAASGWHNELSSLYMSRVHWNGKTNDVSSAARKNALAALLDIANQWKTGSSNHYEVAAHSAYIEDLKSTVERLESEVKELAVKQAEKREELIEARAALTEAYNG